MAEPRPSNLPALKKKFEDFDLEEVYDKVEGVAVDPRAQNFVVQFGPHKAKIAFDLEPDDFKDLLAWSEDDECPVRWINFWNTTKQRVAIEAIGRHYGFTRRQRASITAWDKYREIIKQAAAAKKKQPEPEVVRSATGGMDDDPEMGLNGTTDKLAQAEMAAAQPAPNMEEAKNFKLVQSSMNYTTVDHGDRFTCIGANWLHVRPEITAKKALKKGVSKRLVPPKHWSWLTLCMNGETADTVISIHEAPNLETPPKGEDARIWQTKELEYMRYNTLAVLKQLSKIGIEKNKDNALSLKAIREPLGRIASPPTRSSTVVHNVAAAGSSNLFYYLFEDTLAVVGVLGESKAVLENLSRRIFQSPHRIDNISKNNIIPELHDLGKQLRLLQHLFESYKTLIQTILAPPDADVSERVKLDPQARDRFRRLGDRLQLLMLNTIREFLDEKSELSSTYFNLTAQKDSQATARLTQSATLLAKLSVFFLPISFMTSYFSLSIPEMMDGYTSYTYWGAFGVIAFISFLSLFFFSRLLFVLGEQLSAVSERIDTSITRTLGPHKRDRDDNDDDDDD